MEDYCQLRSLAFLLYQAEILGVTPPLSGATGPWLGHSESHSEASLKVRSQSHGDNAWGTGLFQGHSDGNRHGTSHRRTILYCALILHKFWLP